MKDGEFVELRNAVRFPLRLPIEVKGNRSFEAEMRDISAGGVLFQVDSDVPVGSTLEFTIKLPAGELGTPEDVEVACQGRVTRAFREGGHNMVAATIDEYRFER